MNYSRRQLYALGEPLGDSVTRKEGGKVIYGGGGGGGGVPEKQTQIADLPEWAKGYAQDALARGSALTDINQNPYQTYDAPRIAGFTGMQNQAFQGAQGMTTAPQLGQATDYTNQATQQALNNSYTAGQFGNQYQGINPYAAGQFSAERVGLPGYVQTGQFGNAAASHYMSPYVQQAIEPQLREAARASEIQRNQSQAQAVSQGAYGGSRQAIVEAERQRNLGQLQNDIVAKGYQSAYEQAANQFNQDQGRSLQAQTTNLTSGLQASLANQNMGLRAQEMGEQSRQFGATQAARNAELQAQYGQAAQQLGEQSRQYGAGYGLQSLQAALSGAGQLGQFGTQQFAQNMDINRLLAQYGGQQQQLQQQSYDTAYQDFLNQQRYPYQQLEFMSGLIRGTPMGTVNTMYSPPPNALTQLAGAGSAIYGASKMIKKGGAIKEAKGGNAGLAELALSKMA